MDDFRIIRDNLAGGKRPTRDRLIPSCLYTDPRVAHVGPLEVEAKRPGIPADVVKLPMASVLRTRTIGETKRLHESLAPQEKAAFWASR
jgi:pyruvate/2-oxoglutarate dehydrogenase complex dihydrolipoamide dehydrogenase (E3) component